MGDRCYREEATSFTCPHGCIGDSSAKNSVKPYCIHPETRLPCRVSNDDKHACTWDYRHFFRTLYKGENNGGADVGDRCRRCLKPYTNAATAVCKEWAKTKWIAPEGCFLKTSDGKVDRGYIGKGADSQKDLDGYNKNIGTFSDGYGQRPEDRRRRKSANRRRNSW